MNEALESKIELIIHNLTPLDNKTRNVLRFLLKIINTAFR